MFHFVSRNAGLTLLVQRLSAVMREIWNMARSMREIWGRVFRRIEQKGDCWMWTGPVDRQGYGLCRVGGLQGAQRVSWAWLHGEAPKGVLRNLCGHRHCLRPEHWRDTGAVVESEPVVPDVVVVAPTPEGKIAKRKREVRELIAAGVGIADAAERVGCSRVTVWRYLCADRAGHADSQAAAGGGGGQADRPGSD